MDEVAVRLLEPGFQRLPCTPKPKPQCAPEPKPLRPPSPQRCSVWTFGAKRGWCLTSKDARTYSTLLRAESVRWGAERSQGGTSTATNSSRWRLGSEPPTCNPVGCFTAQWAGGRVEECPKGSLVGPRVVRLPYSCPVRSPARHRPQGCAGAVGTRHARSTHAARGTHAVCGIACQRLCARCGGSGLSPLHEGAQAEAGAKAGPTFCRYWPSTFLWRCLEAYSAHSSPLCPSNTAQRRRHAACNDGRPTTACTRPTCTRSSDGQWPPCGRLVTVRSVWP